MSSRPARTVACVLVLLMMSLSPLIGSASAHDSILLSTDVQHVVLEPGQSTNITLTVENNGSSIETYNLSVDASPLASYWHVLPVDETVNNVFPTWSKNTTIVVRLDEGATVADSGSFTITITEPDNSVSSSVTVLASVAPAYHPSLTTSQTGAVSMASGTSTNLTFTAHNLGTVTDTLLLDVEVEPDLSGWWANQSNNTSNNSNNSGNTSTPTSMSLLMYGNSYTGFNNLGSLVESVIDADGYNGSVTALTGGGLMLSDHWQNVNTSGNQWNTTLRSQTLDYVVLQDQSQVPSLPSSDSYWQESKNASVLLSSEIEDEGAETVLFMTWGRRSGESANQWHQYANINQNFTDMQERLTEGYTRYAENISSAGNTVWIAPVGLAFKTVHDAVVADGDDPTVSGNLFYDLYDNDGSHPSLSGSYLAACVMHSTTTGETCVGSNDSVSLSANVKLALQEAADDTVFNQTAGMSYYPWEVSGTAAFGLGSSVPSGWYIEWQEDEVANLAAGGSQQVTLSVSVPTDAAPDYYGYRLTIGSTNGNVTSSTLLVVEVEAEPSVSLAFLQQNDLFLPGQSTSSAVQLTNTGNIALDLDWDVTADVSSVCQVSMSSAQSQDVQPAEVLDVGFVVDVDEAADSTDDCTLTLTAWHQVEDTMVELEQLAFQVNIDEAVNFTLSGPLNTVDIVPEDGINYEVRVANHGSDAAVFYLDIPEASGLDTVLVSASGVNVLPGEIGVWTVNTKGDTTLSGIL
ncbi:MAG: NEW3 domain-containing protein, partial [Candidatus Poseidonia sp.]|nr:NEW3 domain-containing protein [Poseidonia sp.]